MKHTTMEEIQAYIGDRVTTEQRTAVEDHLYSCVECLQVYMDGLETCQTNLPSLPDPEQWTNQIMDRIAPPRKRWYEYSLFHYGAAAVIMLAVTASGLFFPPNEASMEQRASETQPAPSYSDKLMQQTLTVLDQLKEKGGAVRE